MNRKAKLDESALCCCEYINEENERSHLLATLCNCEAIDEAFERIFTMQSIHKHNIDRIINTVSDRIRIPWPGGARKVPLHVPAALCTVLFTIFLGTHTWTLTITTYTFILPSTLLVIHQTIRRTHKRDSGLSRLRSRFYYSWLVSSIGILLYIYYTQVLAELKINSKENFVFMVLVCVSCTCLYLVRATANPGFQSKVKEGKEDEEEIFESSAWRVCGECQFQVPRHASHCYTCGTCYLLRDHHCVWLDACISCVNDRLFVIGLASGLAGLCYGAQLTLTTVCHPQTINLYFTDILVPHICTDAFINTRYSLSTSAACYSVFLGVCVCVALLQQVVCVVCGVKLREFRHRHTKTRTEGLRAFKQPFENCVKFWWR